MGGGATVQEAESALTPSNPSPLAGIIRVLHGGVQPGPEAEK